MQKLKSAFGITIASMLIAGPLQGQDRDDVRFIGGSGPDATLAQAVIVDNTIYLSGVLGTRAGPTIEDQTRAVMESIQSSLAELGATMDDVVKCTVFMADLSERPRLNEVYRSFFPNNKPARSAVGVDLGGPLVEIECIAVVSDD
jgi:2-iminobutanoate/2-iminopropanoate deaminase